jgi:ubiquinone/menaquinone biosynthesis C-methylase UbiE
LSRPGGFWIWAVGWERCSPHLDRVAPRALVVGLDRAEGMVALGARDFPLLVGDAAELPFADGSFDAVVMAFMLFHLPRPTAGLAEAWRVLRPGGSVGLLTWGTEREPGPAPVGRGARRRGCGRGRREAFLA